MVRNQIVRATLMALAAVVLVATAAFAQTGTIAGVVAS